MSTIRNSKIAEGLCELCRNVVDDTSPLVEFIQRNSIRNFDVECRDEDDDAYSWDPLSYSVKLGNISAVRCLLENGANLDRIDEMLDFGGIELTFDMLDYIKFLSSVSNLGLDFTLLSTIESIPGLRKGIEQNMFGTSAEVIEILTTSGVTHAQRKKL